MSEILFGHLVVNQLGTRLIQRDMKRLRGLRNRPGKTKPAKRRDRFALAIAKKQDQHERRQGETLSDRDAVSKYLQKDAPPSVRTRYARSDKLGRKTMIDSATQRLRRSRTAAKKSSKK